MTETAVWLLAFLAAYWAFCLYFGLTTARSAAGPKSFFLADRNLPAWIVVAAGTALLFNGWFFLGYPELIARDGFPFAGTALGAVTIALGSAFFLKRQWMLGKRFGYVTPGEMAAHYFGGEVIRLAMVVIALVFAVPFAAMQIGVAADLLAGLADGMVSRDVTMWVLSAVVFAYVAFGGMRAAAFVGTLQGVLLVAGMATLGAYAMWLMGGFDAFTDGLAALAAAAAAPAAEGPPPVSRVMFEIPGVVQFTDGLGVQMPAGGIWTGMMIFSYCLALMGLSLNPVFSVLAFSSRSPRGFASQATWASAGAMGGVILLFPVAQGLGFVLLGGNSAVAEAGLALGDTFAGVETGLAGVAGAWVAALGEAAPWFAAIVAVAAVAAVQALAAMAASATSTIIVRDILKRYLAPDLDIGRQRVYARIGIGLIMLAALLVASFAPAAGIALGALALGFGLQLLPVLAGLCWIRWITPPAATVGLVAGMLFVFFTEPVGIAIAAFFGLDLPWGRWPWTMHSGLWGLAANLASVFVISLISQRREDRERRGAFHDFLASHAVLPVQRHYLRLVGWAVALAWLFFAVGPGAVIGNTLFSVRTEGGGIAWPLGIPPLWAWQFAWWALGVLLVWFLADRMGMATMPSKPIEPATRAECALPAPSATGLVVVRTWFWIFVLGGAFATLLNWSFG